MQEKPLRHLLHVDFDSSASMTRSEILRAAGFVVDTVHSAVDSLKAFPLLSFSAVLVHESIRFQAGTGLVRLLKELRPNIPVIILHASEVTDPGGDATFCTFKSPADLITLMKEQLGNTRSYCKTAM